MSDGDGGGGGDGGAAAAAALAAAGGGAGGDGGGASWRDTLPDDLKGHASLANFNDPAALAKGYIDTKAALTARPIVDYTTPEGMKAFTDAVRPAAATDYEIPLRDGETDTALADAFRGFAHQTGMPAEWVKGTAEFFNTQAQAAIEASNAASQKEVDTLKAEMGAGKFAEALAKVNAMLPKMGVQLSEEDMNKLDLKIGSKNLLLFMMATADRVGEPGPINDALGGGGGGGSLTPAQAEAKWQENIKSKPWRDQAKIEGTAEHKESVRLQGIMTAGRAAKKPG